MHRARWVARYRRTFFGALGIAVALRLLWTFGFLIDLGDRAGQRLSIDVIGWMVRIELIAWTLAVASAAAILVSLAVIAYDRVAERDETRVV